jgi:hypothetical protein
METFSIILGTLVVLVIIIALVGSFIWLLGVISSGPTSLPNANSSASDPSMEEGDFHSGPGGYSPNTAYPDTFYGSRGSDSFDDHDEGDFNR